MTAVMQPYLFPYPGYFQLVDAADEFVFYDDVQFIQQGYVNRNELAGGTYTVPLKKMPHTALIRERGVHAPSYGKFLRKWYKTFRLHYGGAPFYPAALRVANDAFEAGAGSIAELAAASVSGVAEYLSLGTRFRSASAIDYDRSLSGQERLLALLTRLGARAYVNSSNGSHLYQEEVFAASGIRLHFLRPDLASWEDRSAARYSILHLLAHYPPAVCRELVQGHYSLIPPAQPLTA